VTALVPGAEQDNLDSSKGVPGESLWNDYSDSKAVIYPDRGEKFWSCVHYHPVPIFPARQKKCQQDPKSYYFPKIQRRYISFFSSCSLNLRVKANVMLQPGLSFQVTCKVKTRVCFGAAGRWKSHGTWGGWGGEGGCIKLKVELLEDEIGS